MIFGKIEDGRITENPRPLSSVFRKKDGRMITGFNRASIRYARRYGYVEAEDKPLVYDQELQKIDKVEWKFDGKKIQKIISLKDRSLSEIAEDKKGETGRVCVEKIRQIYPDYPNDHDMLWDIGEMLEILEKPDKTQQDVVKVKEIKNRWEPLKVLKNRSDQLKRYIEQKKEEGSPAADIVNITWETSI